MKLALITALVLATYAAVILTQMDEIQSNPSVTSIHAIQYSLSLHVMRSAPVPLIDSQSSSTKHDWSTPSLVPYVPVQLHVDHRNLTRTVVETIEGNNSLDRGSKVSRPAQHHPAALSSVSGALPRHSDNPPSANSVRTIYMNARSLELSVEHALGNGTGLTAGYIYRTESWSSTQTATFIVSLSGLEFGKSEGNRPYTLQIDFAF